MPDDDQTTTDDTAEDNLDTDDRDDEDTVDQEHDTDNTGGKESLLADLGKARRQRNAARAELEQTTSLLATARAQLVDQAITREGFKPAGVRAGGLDDAALFDDDGTFDPVAAKHAVTEIARTHGLATTKPAVSERGRDRVPPTGNGWQAALTGK